MNGQVTVTVTRATANQNLLDCTDCGPMGTYPVGYTSSVVHEHMIDIHQCDPNTLDLRNI
jgi:hypothetical protein